MMNCQHLPATKYAALKDLAGLIEGFVRKGLVPANLQSAVLAGLTTTIGGRLATGATGADVRRLIDQYLAPAVAAASAASARGTASSSATYGRFGGSGSPAAVAASSAALPGAAVGGFFDPARASPGAADPALGIIPSRLGTANAPQVAVSGREVAPGELARYFAGEVPQDDDSFAVALWLRDGRNPMLLLEELAYAKRLHNDVILPCARYYKELLYGNPDYPTRLGQILYGIVAPDVVRAELSGGPTSRHLLGQAVNFQILGVDSVRVVEDIAHGHIPVRVGTYALVNGIHASLPFRTDGQTVERLRLWADPGIPGFVGYTFT